MVRDSPQQHAPHVVVRAPLVFVLLALLTGLAYWNSLENGFALDDQMMIEKNRLITGTEYLPILLTSDYWEGFRDSAAAHTVTSGLYRPLVLLSFALNYAAGGLDFYGYHAMNVLLHLMAGWLVYLLAQQLGLSEAGALVSAVVFVVHPLHTEAVSNVVGRAELLMAIGVLAGLRWGIQGRTALSLGAFLLGLLSKEQAVVLPLLLLLSDLLLGRWRTGDRRRSTRIRHLLPRYTPYVVLLGGYIGLRWMALGGLHPPTIGYLENPLPYLDWHTRLLTTIKVAGLYLRFFFWPLRLSADYSYDSIPFNHSLLDAGVIFSVVAWAALFGLSAGTYRRVPQISLAVGFLVVTFLPTSNALIPIGTIMAERQFYLPSAGLCFLVGWGYERLESRFRLRPRLRTTPRSTLTSNSTWPPLNLSLNLNLILRGLLVVLCLAMIWRTMDRNRDWMNTETVLLSVLRIHPNNAKAYSWMGITAIERQDWKAAVDHYEEAFRIYPEYATQDPGNSANLGLALVESGRVAEGLNRIEQAIEMWPNWSLLRSLQGLAYARIKSYSDAERAFLHAQELKPDSWQAHYGLSRIYFEQEQYEAALREAEMTISVQADLMEPHYFRAPALESLGRSEDAIEEYARVMKFNQAPGDVAERYYRLQAAHRGPG